MLRDVVGIELQQPREIDILGIRRQQRVGGNAAISRAQHGAAPVKGDGGIGRRIKQRPKPARAETAIRGGDQVGCGIGQRAVQIEDDGARIPCDWPSCFTPRKAL